MKNLKHIEIENLIDWYQQIIDNKDDGVIKTDLLNLLAQISLRYNHYEENFNHQNLIQIIDSIYVRNHEGLTSCYKSEGKILKQLKKLIREKQDKEIQGICQYCGILKPKTMDHYLPISVYPEFAVFAINLLPCCKDCNGKKNNYWKENNERGIINFYVDNIPNEQFLFGVVKIVSGIPHIEYELRMQNGITPSFFNIAVKHFNRLELLNLYKEESTTELGEIIRSVRNYAVNPTLNSVRNSLLRDWEDLRNIYGDNYWRAVLRRTLAESDEALNFIIN